MLKQVKAVFRLSQLQQFFLLLVLCQVVFWYFGSPGPSLLDNVNRGIGSALSTIGFSILFLFIIPFIWLKTSGFNLRQMGFQFGDVQSGLKIVSVLFVILIPILFFATNNTAMLKTYPWSGGWAGESFGQYVVWIGLYAIYYMAYEFFYRGFILQAGERFFAPDVCMLLQVLFSVMIHLGKPLPETLAAIPAGFLVGWLAIRTKSLVYPILLHLVIGATTDLFSLYHQNLLDFF